MIEENVNLKRIEKAVENTKIEEYWEKLKRAEVENRSQEFKEYAVEVLRTFDLKPISQWKRLIWFVG